jgi:hypothetical protein
MGYDIDTIRQQVKAKLKKGKDPTEFRAPKMDEGKTAKFRFYVLPPLQEGDVCNGGKLVCERSMELFAIPTGAHYIDNKRIGCPRIINEEECAICQYGFDLLSEVDGTTTEGKKKRSEISKNLLPAQYHLVNLYFSEGDFNPEEVRGKVLWWNAPKTVVDTWLECLYRDDDGGDQLELLAYGIFFDECHACQFQLEVCKDGQMNSYKKSKFLPGKRPIAIDKNTKKIDMKRIKEILDKRHNLWEKMPEINQEEVARVAAVLSGRAAARSNAGGFDRDEEAAEETAGETVQEAAPVKAAKPVVKSVATKPVVKPVATKPVVKPVATKPVATKPVATKPVATKPKKEELPKEEPGEETYPDEDADLAGEVPADEVVAEEVTEEAAEAVVEETADESDAVDSEIDRMLGELSE